jgi:formate/nitrite transporter FocA (FNT family)
MSSEETRRKRAQTSPNDPQHREFVRDHPLEEAQKSDHTILEQQITESEEELDRPALALLLSGLTAGLDLGFGPFVMAVNGTLTKDVLAKPIQDLLNAGLYTIGFLFVVLGRSALFTEQTTSALLPVLGRRRHVSRLLRLWGLVLIANLVGAALFSLFAVHVGPALGVTDVQVFGAMAHTLTAKSTATVLFSAIGAGWLMGLLSWLVISARDTIGQIVIVCFTTSIIAIARLHHSIAGSTEVLMGVFSGVGVMPGDYLHFLVWSVLGNALGGVVFVGLLKFHVVERSN